MAVEQHFTLLRTLLPTNQAQHRGLATTRRTHQGRDFAAGNGEGDAVQHRAVTISEGDIAQFNKRGWRGEGVH